MIDLHEQFMREALNEAHSAFLKNEVPVGAVIVYNRKIIARAHNLVETLKDSTAHAEILCIRQAAFEIGNWRLSQASLYCTLEPCPMCAGAMIHSRLTQLVWGAADVRCGAHGSWIDLLGTKHPIHQVQVISGVLREESSFLLKDFFRRRRQVVPISNDV